MAEGSGPWHSTVYCMLPHPTEPRLLLRQGSDSSWSLPAILLEQFVWMPDIGPILPQIAESLRRRATMLFCPRYVIEREPDQRVEVVYAFENHSSLGQLADGAAWIGCDDLAALPLTDQNHRNVIEAFMAELEGGAIPDLRPAWSRPGWFTEAEAWILGSLASAGYQVLSPIESMRNWGISCVLRIKTDRGLVYFKVASSRPLFGHEPM